MEPTGSEVTVLCMYVCVCGLACLTVMNRPSPHALTLRLVNVLRLQAAMDSFYDNSEGEDTTTPQQVADLMRQNYRRLCYVNNYYSYVFVLKCQRACFFPAIVL